MKIREINAMRGPNYWSVRRHKLIVMVLDLEKMEEALLGADLGWELTDNMIKSLQSPCKKDITLSGRFCHAILGYLNGMTEKKELQKV